MATVERENGWPLGNTLYNLFLGVKVLVFFKVYVVLHYKVHFALKIQKYNCFLLRLGKMSVFGLCIFEIDGKKPDLFIYFSVYIMCNFASENKELPLIMLCLHLS